VIEHALDYARRGWLVLPLHTPDPSGHCSCRKADCGSPGKHPRTLNGLKDATTEEAKICHWWALWPDANVGVATGEVSGLVVIDVDTRHGGEVSMHALIERHGDLPPRRERVYSLTGGGGWHLLFAHPGVRIGNVQSSDRLGAGVDVRGDGGYIVAPPSLHASGARYAWGAAPAGPLPALPPWLAALLTERPAATRAPGAVEGEIPEGQRDKTLASLAGTMRRRGMGADAIYAALAVENETKCNPPLPDEDVRRISRSISRYSPQDPALEAGPRVSDNEEGKGIYEVADLSDAIDELYERGMTGGHSTGWPTLDYHYTVKRGQWTIVTGMPSHGKSAVLDALLVNLARDHGWRFCVCSPENQPLSRHAANLLAIWAGEPFGRRAYGQMTRDTLAAGKRWLAEHFTFLLPDEVDCTVAGILDLATEVHARREIQGLVIDPWNELEHRRPAQMTETEYTSQSLTRMRRFARSNELHLWLVAHPTKLQKDVKSGNYPVPTLYDISGSAHFRNKADMGLSVWRDVLNEKSPTEIHVQKVRFRECGSIGKCELYYDLGSGRFTEESPHFGYVPDEEAERAALEKM
jgi:hypothetical protein